MYTTTEIKQLEQLAGKEAHLSEWMMMQQAGKAAFNVLQQNYPYSEKLAVFCGSGNNAGDGYVLAMHAKLQGKEVTCFYLKNPEALKPPALTAYEQARKHQVKIISWQRNIDLESYDIFVDALLGTGFKGQLTEEYCQVIQAINEQAKPTIALDVPSGLNADTGKVNTIAVKSTHTVTLIGLKQGLFTADALDYCGEVVLEALGLPKALFDTIYPSADVIPFDVLKETYLLPRKRNSHKGNYGHVAIIGGDYGMSGAMRMASETCTRAGAGLTSAYTRPEHVAIIATERPEIMAHPLAEPTQLPDLISRASVIAIGPGLGRQSWGEACFNAVLKLEQPKVLDADALWWLAGKKICQNNWVLTPHAKEAATLLGITPNEVQNDRFTAIVELQKRYGGVIVLKGAGSLIFDGNYPIRICPYGNPGMASGGMGDVLTGLIAGLIAQHIPLFEAACLAVSCHAKAADRCAERLGERGMLALDLLSFIRELIN